MNYELTIKLMKMDIVQVIDETSKKSQCSVDDSEIEILPLIYEIMKRFAYLKYV